MLKTLFLLAICCSFAATAEWEKQVDNLVKYYPHGVIFVAYGDKIDIKYNYTYNGELFTRQKNVSRDISSAMDYIKQINPPKEVAVEILIRSTINDQVEYSDILSVEIKKFGIDKVGACLD